MHVRDGVLELREAHRVWQLAGLPGVAAGNQRHGLTNQVPTAFCAAKQSIPSIFLYGQHSRKFDHGARQGSFDTIRQPRPFAKVTTDTGVIENSPGGSTRSSMKLSDLHACGGQEVIHDLIF